MSFFQKIYQRAETLRHQIIYHPYNIDLFNDTLCSTKFKTYLTQDSVYLRHYARLLTQTAVRFEQEAHVEYAQIFRDFANATVAAAEDLDKTYIQQWYSPTLFSPNNTVLLPSMATYINHLTDVCQQAPLPQVVASLMPCFWTYAETGKALGQSISPDHSYKMWIELQYCSPEFDAFTELYTHILEQLAYKIPLEEQEAMIEIFIKSLEHELALWNEVYGVTELRNALTYI